jgi:hypothetical protein
MGHDLRAVRIGISDDLADASLGILKGSAFGLVRLQLVGLVSPNVGPCRHGFMMPEDWDATPRLCPASLRFFAISYT